LAKEVKKRNQQSTRLWLLSRSSSVKWSAWIPALTTNKKGSSSLNKLDNEPDCFFTTQHAYLLCATTLWTERCLTTASRQYTCDGRHQGTLLLWLLWLFMSFFCICANDICCRLLICNVWLSSTLSNKIK
jgi:hypothetical protein